VTSPLRDRPVLVYDGDCAICTQSVLWMEAHIPYRPVIEAWQFADLAALGLTQAQCERAVQWVEPDGRVWSGSQAVGKLLVASRGLWQVLGWLALVPPTRWIASGVYRLIADNRHRLPGGTPACSMPAHLRPGAQDRAA
jgi:predicted DCC family thiol-disulfide oxidoreductase YuxK